ncbi:MAG: COG1470 family protein [Candidatus Helarchaeota archaeon]
MSVLVNGRPYYEVGLSIIPESQETKPEENTLYTINVKNLGNVNDTFKINLEGEIPNSMIELEANQITLQPNESSLIKINVTILES